MTQRLTLSDGAGNVLAQVEGEEPELVHDLPAGDYVLEATELDEGGETALSPEDEAELHRQLAPDGTAWATYLGSALGAFLSDPLHQPAPWEQWQAWDAAGRPER